MSFQLHDKNNFGCQLRDGIYKNMDIFKINGMVHHSEIKRRLEQIVIPEKYYGDIFEMIEYKQYYRCTDFVEQQLASIVYRQIVDKLVKEEYGK